LERISGHLWRDLKINAKIFFDVFELYYLPQYLPIFVELNKRGQSEVTFIFYQSKYDNLVKGVIEAENLNHIWVSSMSEANAYYQLKRADWVIFSNRFHYLDAVNKVSKTARIGHGIGAKSSYYSQSDSPTTVRFVEGEYKTSRLRRMYPDSKFINTGFSKLDPILNGELCGSDLKSLSLDPAKKTIIYAPSFYPSSIERFPKNFPEDFQEFNIIIKPHYFSLSKEKYKGQRKLLELWAKYTNVYLAQVDDYSLVPFMAIADLLISDTSSAIIEFAALDKPVIWCNFLKLRWTYRGVFSYRFKKRMDKDYQEYSKVAVRSDSYKMLKRKVSEQLLYPKALSNQRLRYAEKMAGTLDGKASKRIVDYLLKNQ
jgi:CDP-glycerol glycerophosphotransferase (TagB/SpsB family)